MIPAEFQPTALADDQLHEATGKWFQELRRSPNRATQKRLAVWLANVAVNRFYTWEEAGRVKPADVNSNISAINERLRAMLFEIAPKITIDRDRG